MRKRYDLLAAASRLERGGGMGAPTSGTARRTQRSIGHRLGEGRPGRLKRSSKKGGEETGPNPTDRGKSGSKHHLVVDAQGLPLAALVGPANEHDSMRFDDLLDGIKPVAGRRGAPRRRPQKLHADKGYDYPRCRRSCQHRGIIHRIARRGIESKERLGRHRWVVERTFAWLHRFRRLSVRYERRADIHLAFLTLGCALISLRFVERLC